METTTVFQLFQFSFEFSNFPIIFKFSGPGARGAPELQKSGNNWKIGKLKGKLENIGINWKTQLFSNYSNFPLSFQIFKLFSKFLGPELDGASELQKNGNNLQIGKLKGKLEKKTLE